MTRDIIDAIDHAITDYETSGDAMRWTPEPPVDPPEREGQHVSWIEYDETQLWPVAPTDDELAAAFDPLGNTRDIIVVLQPHFGRFVEVMWDIHHALERLWQEIRRNGPAPLPIDGHEYRRRTRARRRTR